MSFLSTWGSQLVYLVLFATLIEAVLPAGDIRSYTKMVLGLVVVVAIVSPLLGMVEGGAWVDPLFFAGVNPEQRTDTESIIQNGLLLSRTAISEAASEAQATVQQQAASLLYTLGGVEEAQVDVGGNRPIVTLRLSPEAEKTYAGRGGLAQRAAALVGGFLGVESDLVDVRVHAGGGQ